MKPASWQIISPEYPPQIGGVGDYSRSVAAELEAQGERTYVWHPLAAPLEGGYSRRALAQLSAAINQTPAPRRLFVQWVPHGYGHRAMNVPFAWWLRERARLGDHLDLMVHEAFLPFREGTWRQDLVALVHRLMITLALGASSRVWVSIPRWTPQLRPWLFGRRIPIEWLPVPSNIPLSPEAGVDLAAVFGNSAPTVGHFGTYGRQILAMLHEFVPRFLALTEANLLLLGRDSDQAAREFGSPRVAGPGTLEPAAISRWLRACDLLYQPYTDGVSTRRGSAMAALSHGRALLTTSGIATESIWREQGAVALLPVPQDPYTEAFARQSIEATAALLGDPLRREQLGTAARHWYDNTFAVPLLVRRLRESSWSPQ